MNKNKIYKISIINMVTFLALFFFAGLVLVLVCKNSHQAFISIPLPIQFESEYSQQSSFDGDLILRGQFAEELLEGAEMNFYLNHIGVAIYLNGEMIYESSYENYPEMCGSAWATWVVPALTSDDVIEIRLHNPHSYGNGNAYNEFLDSILMSRSVALKAYYDRQSMPYRIFCVFILVVSIAFIGTAIGYAFLHLPNSTLLTKLGIMSLLMGLYMYFDAKDIALRSYQLVLNTYVRQISIILGSFMFVAAIKELLDGKRKKIATITVYVLALADFVFLALSLSGVMQIYDTGIYWAIIQGIISLLLIVICILEIKKAEKSKKIMLFSAVALLAVLIAELINARLSWWQSGICIKLVFGVLFVLHLVRAVKLMAVNYQASIRARKLEQELKENQITLAMSQIKPHFVYNALNSIYHLCDKDVGMAQQAISDFSDYLRSSLSAVERTTQVSFEEELKHVKTYLSLEQLRFGNDLKVEYHIDTTQFMIPAMSVQPLVENAVKHGICQKEEGGGTLNLTVRESQEYYDITVTDDGVGFIPENEYKDQGTHVGIKNVRQRLELMCDGTLEITSEPGKGTTARIRIPKENDA